MQTSTRIVKNSQNADGVRLAQRLSSSVLCLMVGLAGAVVTPGPVSAAAGHTAFVVARSLPVEQTGTTSQRDLVGAQQLYSVDMATGRATSIGSLNLAPGFVMSSLTIASDG